MASILPFDELNTFVDRIRNRFSDGVIPSLNQREEDDIIDEMLDLFLLAYATGNIVTNENLGADWQPTLDDIDNVVNEEVAGETWEERARNYFLNGGTGDDLIRIAETETHRIANESALRTAREDGARFKTWMTMMDDRVRETHDYLLGETRSIDEDFYTFDGDHASAPGKFELAENNVNCRCELVFS